VSAPQESLKDEGAREEHRFPESSRRKICWGAGGGLGCRLRDVGVPRGRVSSRRRHQESFIEEVIHG